MESFDLFLGLEKMRLAECGGLYDFTVRKDFEKKRGLFKDSLNRYDSMNPTTQDSSRILFYKFILSLKDNGLIANKFLFQY